MTAQEEPNRGTPTLRKPKYFPKYIANIDFETKSSINLKQDTTWNYASHESTKVLLMSWNINKFGHETNTNDTKLWEHTDRKPKELFRFLKEKDSGIQCHNSWFEYLIWKFVCYGKMGWPEMPDYRFHCTAARCSNFGMPSSLEGGGAALGLGTQKDKRGVELINLFSIPVKKAK